MVDALRECWRVLVSGGLLVDLRPVATSAPIEIVSSDNVAHAGSIDGSPGIVDDVASDRAMDVAVSEGWLERIGKVHFDFSFYWDSIDEMAKYLADHWQRRRVDPPPADLKAAREAFAISGAGSRLRSKERMLLATYRRGPERRPRPDPPLTTLSDH
jgi:hypothetical protein